MTSPAQLNVQATFHSHVWQTKNQAIVIVTLALASIALVTGMIVVLHSYGMDFFPVNVVNSIGQSGGSMLVGGGFLFLMIDFILMGVLSSRNAQFKEQGRKFLKEELTTIVDTLAPKKYTTDDGYPHFKVIYINKESKLFCHFFSHREEMNTFADSLKTQGYHLEPSVNRKLFN